MVQWMGIALPLDKHDTGKRDAHPLHHVRHVRLAGAEEWGGRVELSRTSGHCVSAANVVQRAWHEEFGVHTPHTWCCEDSARLARSASRLSLAIARTSLLMSLPNFFLMSFMKYSMTCGVGVVGVGVGSHGRGWGWAVTVVWVP